MMLRTLFAALLLLPLALASASAGEKHKLALQISDNDADKMNAVLNVAANVSKFYSDKGEDIDIQIVAFNAGLHMLRDDTSPVKARLKSFKQGMPNASFMACESTLESWPA
jgi:intracellular sulfur oxidation DsrE/DsrF family protein